MTKPKINPPLRLVDKIIEALAAICVLYMVVQLIVEFPVLEQDVPSHFGENGKPDAWENKSSLLILPVVTIFLYVGLTILNRYPHLFNYPVPITEKNVVKQYQFAKSLLTTLKFTAAGLFLYIQIQTISVVKQMRVALGTSFLVLVILGSFIPIIIYLVIASKNK